MTIADELLAEVSASGSVLLDGYAGTYARAAPVHTKPAHTALTRDHILDRRKSKDSALARQPLK
jgi:hypothetical protein